MCSSIIARAAIHTIGSVTGAVSITNAISNIRFAGLMVLITTHASYLERYRGCKSGTEVVRPEDNGKNALPEAQF